MIVWGLWTIQCRSQGEERLPGSFPDLMLRWLCGMREHRRRGTFVRKKMEFNVGLTVFGVSLWYQISAFREQLAYTPDTQKRGSLEDKQWWSHWWLWLVKLSTKEGWRKGPTKTEGKIQRSYPTSGFEKGYAEKSEENRRECQGN